MKLKTSFFDATVLKKDLTRFLPLWLIYLICGVMLSQSITLGDMYFSVASAMDTSLMALSIVNLVYALLVAQLLYGDLFNSRLCNAIHALPVRREGLFLTHTVSGLAMSLGPNLVIAALLMPALGRLWFIGPLWVLGVTAQYVLFFGLAVFCMQCAGNRFAAVAMYTLFNFFALIVMWFYSAFYEPLLYGLSLTQSSREIFYYFSPVVWLCNQGDWIILEHLSTCPNYHRYEYHTSYNCLYAVTGLGEGWWYLLILSLVGIALAAVSLIIYRKRHLESAGDFVSFRPMRTVFAVPASACVGGLFFLIGCVSSVELGYVFMSVGFLVGFFGCQMLLQRTVKVFGRKNWLKFGIFCLAVVLSFVLTAVDAFGLTRRIPNMEDVQSVTIAEGYLSDYRLEQITENAQNARGVDPYYQNGRDGMLTLRDPAQIAQVMEIHELLREEGDAREQGRNWTTVTIHYVLKNGTTLTRYYYGKTGGEAVNRLKNFTNTPQYILGVSSPEELLQDLIYAYLGEYGEVKDPQWLEKLAHALYADAAAGNLNQSVSGAGMLVDLQYENREGYYRYLSLAVGKAAQNTNACISEYVAWLKGNGI